MHPKDINVFHLETGTLELCYDPAKGARGIGTREDIFVHEQAPNKVFVLPGRTNTSDLENEDAVVVEKVVDLSEGRYRSSGYQRARESTVSDSLWYIV